MTTWIENTDAVGSGWQLELERTTDVKIEGLLIVFSHSESRINRAQNGVKTDEDTAGKDGTIYTDVGFVLPRISQLSSCANVGG
jgi:hypothetical protein